MLYLFHNHKTVHQTSNTELDYLNKTLQQLFDREACIYGSNNKFDELTPGEQIANYYLDAIRGEHIFEAVLGALFFEGERVKQDFKEAFFWCLKAAEYGIGMDESQYLVGRMYEYGQGVERNNAKAIDWYLKAAAQDNILALSRLTELIGNRDHLKA